MTEEEKQTRRLLRSDERVQATYEAYQEDRKQLSSAAFRKGTLPAPGKPRSEEKTATEEAVKAIAERLSRFDVRVQAAYEAYQEASLTLKEVAAEYFEAASSDSVSRELYDRYEHAYIECQVASATYTELLQGKSSWDFCFAQ